MVNLDASPATAREYAIFASYMLAGLRLSSLAEWRRKGCPGAMARRQPAWRPAERGEIDALFAGELRRRPALRPV